MIHIQGKTYALVKEHKDGWNAEVFRARYSDVLERYDYIVGDWGYNQLRLKGFYKETSNKATKDSNIASFEDYINEYCNFGCAYFVLQKVEDAGKGNGRTDHAAASAAAAAEQPAAHAEVAAPASAPSGEV